VMTPEFGAASQLEKIDMLDFADFVAINKFDRKGADDALRDVRKQVQRNREAFREPPESMPVFGTIAARFNDDGVTALYHALADEAQALLDSWPATVKAYSGEEQVVKVRGKEIRTRLTTTSLSGTTVPKVALPRYECHGELLRWRMLENLPGEFPYTGGVFHFKRENEDPTRMFAGEGDAFRTNKRFHLL